jgi:hypothetical protein
LGAALWQIVATAMGNEFLGEIFRCYLVDLSIPEHNFHGIRAIFGKSELAMKADQVDAAGARNYISLDEPSSWAGNNSRPSFLTIGF